MNRLKLSELAMVFTVILLLAVGASDAVRLYLSSNYILDYELTNGNRSIDFKIQAINVTGWVGIGVNNGSATMDGSDLFIGGNRNGSAYGADYHVPRGSGLVQPTLDTKQDWVVVNATEANTSTTIHVRRLLDTGDAAQDLIIENKNMSLLWSYNANSDNVTMKHTARGAVYVNLVETGAGDDEGGEPTLLPTTTTPRTNLTTPSGAPIVNVKISVDIDIDINVNKVH